MTVGFGVAEYTLVFRRTLGGAPDGQTNAGWTVARPQGATPRQAAVGGAGTRAGVAQVLAVPICSALGLEGAAYEQFLLQSGVLDDVLHLLAGVELVGAHSLDTARKQVQSVVMAAEVGQIVSKITKGA